MKKLISFYGIKRYNILPNPVNSEQNSAVPVTPDEHLPAHDPATSEMGPTILDSVASNNPVVYNPDEHIRMQLVWLLDPYFLAAIVFICVLLLYQYLTLK